MYNYEQSFFLLMASIHLFLAIALVKLSFLGELKMVIPGSYREGDIGPWPEPRELQQKNGGARGKWLLACEPNI